MRSEGLVISSQGKEAPRFQHDHSFRDSSISPFHRQQNLLLFLNTSLVAFLEGA